MSDLNDPGAQPTRPAQPGWTQGPPATTDGLDPKVGGLLSYLLFGWVGGLIMYFTQRHPEVRFHAAQSVLFGIAWTVLWVLWSVVTGVVGLRSAGLALLLSLVSLVIALGGFALWVMLCIQGYNLKHMKLPVIGDVAEQWAAK